VGLKSLTGMSNCTVLYFAANHSKVEYRTSITDGKSFYQIKINIKSFIFICIKMYLSLQTGRCPPAYRRHIRIIEHASNNKLYNLTIIESPEIVRTYIWRRGRAGRRGPGATQHITAGTVEQYTVHCSVVTLSSTRRRVRERIRSGVATPAQLTSDQ